MYALKKSIYLSFFFFKFMNFNEINFEVKKTLKMSFATEAETPTQSETKRKKKLGT